MSFHVSARAYQAAQFLNGVINRYYPFLRDQPLPVILARLKPCRHSIDYRSVRWFGTSYVFTPAQAVIIRELWRAWEDNTPKVGAAALLEASDMVSDKIGDLFKRSLAWGKMVHCDGKGIYWLAGS